MKLDQLVERNAEKTINSALVNKERFVKEFIYEYQRLYISLKDSVDSIINCN
jgi:hypothetical protein